MIKRRFKLLSDAEFWKLPNGEKLQYLKSAVDHSRRLVSKGPAKPRRPVTKKSK